MIRTLVLAVALLLGFSFTGCVPSRNAPDPGTGNLEDAGDRTTVPGSGGPTGTLREAAAKEESDGGLHASFRISFDELEMMVRSLRRETRERIASSPEQFLEHLIPVLSIPEDVLALVDKSHSLPPEYVPDDLVRLSDHGFIVNRNNLLLRSSVLTDLRRMTDAAADDGVKLNIISAHRSYEYQALVYERHVATYGQEAADRESARPGMSQHQLGTVLDIGTLEDDFGETLMGRWLLANAWRYGFSLSYPEGFEEYTGYKYEPWHYRWISPDATLVERHYFGGVQQEFLEFLRAYRDELKSAMIGDR